MNIFQYDHQDIRVVEFDGRIDAQGTQELAEALAKAYADGRSKVVMDMGKVSYLNSQSLHLLAKALVENQDRGGDVRFARLTPIVQRVFEIIGLRQQIKTYSSVEAALQGM